VVDETKKWPMADFQDHRRNEEGTYWFKSEIFFGKVPYMNHLFKN